MTPSIWPTVLSAGLALVAFGVPTSPWFCLAGGLLLVLALVGWIGEVRRGGEHGAH